MLDAPGMIAWVRRAKAADAVVYGREGEASRAVLAVAVRLQDQGLVDLTRKADALGRQLIMQRRAKLFCRNVSARGSMVHKRYSPEALILRAIRTAARNGKPCPTNIELAEAAALTTAVAASYRLRKLVRDGKLTLIDHGPYEHREAILGDTGQATVRAPL
jgi:hypothetical protein